MALHGIFESSGSLSKAKASKDVEETSHFKADSSSTVIVSVVENRAREICLSKYDTGNGSRLEIYIVTDCHSYSEVLLLLQDISPNEILLHDGSKSRVLSQKIESHIGNACRILYISRQYFDQDRGADLLTKLVVGNIDADLIAKYTVLAGAFCLLRYIENCQGFQFAPKSLRLEYCNCCHGRTTIDRGASVSLELITNAISGNQKDSLFGSINFTKTVVGARLLRTNILRPSTMVRTLNSRLDVVELLLRNNAIFVELSSLLETFPNLDRMLTGLTAVPKQKTLASARMCIDTLIYLKQSLKGLSEFSRVIQRMKDAFQPADNSISSETSDLLQAMIAVTTHEAMLSLLNDIEDLLVESTTYLKSSYEMRHQECFALRSGVSGALDIARKTFLLCVQDLYAAANRYSEEYGITVKVAYTASRGYYLSLPADTDPLPDMFIRAVLNMKTISCTTLEVSSLSDRATDAIRNALGLTHDLIQGMLDKVRLQIDSLFALVDCVALLDMLCSFADLVALSPQPHTRPLLSETGLLVISGGRHPVLCKHQTQFRNSSFVENDTYLDPSLNFQILTGANGSGKTVYIKQVVLIVIMAQIGCFVPARHATVPVRDRILARLGTSDDMEHNMSTFFTEMKDCAYIINSLTPRSLVVIDELGRGTSNIDGLSIAFAIAEHLASSPALTLFVSHFSQISSLEQMYPNITNIHMKPFLEPSSLPRSDDASAPHSYRSTHQLASGPFMQRSGYGVTMAELCGFPPDVIASARSLLPVVSDSCPVLLQREDADRTIFEMNALVQQLSALQNSTMNEDTLRRYLQSIRNGVSDVAVSNILNYIRKLDEPERNASAKRGGTVNEVDLEHGPSTKRPAVSLPGISTTRSNIISSKAAFEDLDLSDDEGEANIKTHLKFIRSASHEVVWMNEAETTSIS